MKITADVPKRLARKREEGKGGIGYRRAERRQPDERRASPDNGAASSDAIGGGIRQKVCCGEMRRYAMYQCTAKQGVAERKPNESGPVG